MAIRAYARSTIGGPEWYDTQVNTGINFTSEEVTNAPVSKVYLNDKLIWQPYYTVTIKYTASALDRLEISTVALGADQFTTTQSSISSTGSNSFKFPEGQILLITPIAKSGYTVTSHHDKYIAVTGAMTINITTKAATKGKLNKPVLTGGNSGRVDSSYRCYGTFENRNSVTVSAVSNVYYIDGTPKQDSDHAAQSNETYSNIWPKSQGTGYTVTAVAEGRGMESFKGKHLIAIKFTADGYEDSDWAFWSDYSPLVNSTAYTTGQIPAIDINSGETSYNGEPLDGKIEYYDDDSDGDYKVWINFSAYHPMDWPTTILSPKGVERVAWSRTSTGSRRDQIIYDDMPPDNLWTRITCYDPLGLFKSTTTQLTQSDFVEMSFSS